MTGPVRLLLARHGRTDWHRDNRYLSRTDIGLDEPGREPLESGAGRILAVFTDLGRSHAGETVLVVAHNTLIRLGLCAVLGVPLGEYRRRFPRVVNGAVSEVRFGGGGGALYSFNDTRHAEGAQKEGSIG